MAARKLYPAVLAIATLILCGFSYRLWPGGVSEGVPSGWLPSSADERVIRQLNEECLHAYDTGDASTLDRIEGADFTVSGDFGVISKREHLDQVRQRTAKTDVISRKIDPQVFRFYESVALVTETDRPTTKDGTFAFQSTEVWLRVGDSWKLVHLHYSQLEEKK
jgi:hypothetical protein